MSDKYICPNSNGRIGDMFRGTIVFMLCNQGSKSEGLFPFLYEGNGSFLRLYKEGDNPFENESLKVFDGQVVDLEGDWNEI